ncbi:MAG: beta-ketoacyl-ACP synthase [Rhodospirillales bacterium]|jgi:3-oxoacyl-[acyl-carrier-protein] synthase II|nr:beta-ketoacyl-ACP synthase [Rhodospirillales bacterium]
MAAERDAVITGIGLVSSLGEGMAAHWAALTGDAFRPVLDTESFPPYPLHPLPPIAFERQIPKRGDLRQMETWQRLGTYAAGLALDEAGLKGQPDLLQRTELIVAAGGGERDPAADVSILTDLPAAADPESLLNQRLLSDLRPTLFLAQLSNLLAGNISIVHGVVGGSRSFMGEEPAGVDAVRVAVARIAAGQGDLFLVGAAAAPVRPEVLLHYEMGGLLRKRNWAPVWARQADGGGMALGTLGCFLVIESRAHAAGRGMTPVAAIASVANDRCRRQPGEATANATRQLAALNGRIDPAATAVISGASGAAAATQEERDWLAGLGMPVRAVATAVGHTMEPAFPAAMAIAAIAVREGRLFPPLEAAETPMPAPLRAALVTGWGHWRGEALGLVTPA